MKTFLGLDHLRHEVRILGPVLFLVPLALVAGFAGLTGMFLVGNVVHILIVSLLIAALEACLPLAAGIILSTIAVQDASLELLLTLPVAYRRIVFLRFALILGWTLLVEWGASLALSAFLPWVPVKSLAAFQLTWLAPSLWLSGACILLALLLRNQASSGAIVGCVWIMQLLFHGFFVQNG